MLEAEGIVSGQGRGPTLDRVEMTKLKATQEQQE
jgi:hypothetical protein